MFSVFQQSWTRSCAIAITLLVSGGVVGCSAFNWVEDPSDPSVAGGDRGWYASVAGSFSNLEPDTSESSVFSIADSNDSGFNIALGRDLRERFSAELRFGRLGSAILSPLETVEYSFVDLSGIYYPFVDSYNVNRREGLLPFFRGGITRMIHDSTVALEREDNFFVVAGLGVDYLFSSNFGVRAEFNLHDTDAQAAHFGVLYRFGGRDLDYVPPDARADQIQTANSGESRSNTNFRTAPDTQLTRPPVFRPPGNNPPNNQTPSSTDTTVAVQKPERQELQELQIIPIPVATRLLTNGPLSDLQFKQASAQLDSRAQGILNQLAIELRQNPSVRVELQAHTDGARNPDFAMRLARARVAQVGRYLVGQGVPVAQLVARAFGDQRPRVSDVRSPINNRVELLVLSR